MMERRQLLKLAAASAAPVGWWGYAQSRPALDVQPFGCGVASGSPTHDGVVLWTRIMLADAVALRAEPLAVRWEIAQDEAFRHIIQRGDSVARPELGYAVHVEVAGLTPDRWYYYRFHIGGVTSPVGRTRTLAAPGTAASRLRLAYASCQRWEHGYYAAYRHMRDENVDAVLFVGDYIYEYPGATDPVRWVDMNPRLGFVITLDDYRARYALYKSDPDLQAMHAACPWLLTWDDHEVQNDYAGLQAGNGTRADVFSDPARFAERRAAAYQAYYENMPLRTSVLMRAMDGLLTRPQAAEMRIYQRVDHGKLASIYLLDTRQYKDPQACTPRGALGASMVNPAQCLSWYSPQRSLLGVQQEGWLQTQWAQAGRSTVAWNVIAQSTLFGQRDNKAGPDQAFFNDGWDGYAACRQRLTDAMQRHALANPVLLGGDVHENWVGHVLGDYAAAAQGKAVPTVGVEFCGTSISSRAGDNSNKNTAKRLAENPHFVFGDAARRGYGVAEFTPKQLTTTLRVVHDVTQAETGIETLAQFTVQAGRSVIEKA